MKRTPEQKTMIKEFATLVIEALTNNDDFMSGGWDFKDCLTEAMDEVKDDLYKEIKKEVIEQNEQFGFFEVNND